MSVPYASASSDTKARAEITKILRNFGCENVGFMDNFDDKSVMLAFRHKGRAVQLNASAKGWAAMYLRENPWTRRRQYNRDQWNEKALNQGLIAINSILRDWVKGQVTAVETGIMSFEAVFMPHMLTHTGEPLIDVMMAKNLLPAPTDAAKASQS